MNISNYFLFIPAVAIIIPPVIFLFFKKESKIKIFFNKYFLYYFLFFFIINGAYYTLLLPYWSPIDEGSHFSYIQHIAEKKNLPLLNDLVSNEVLEISQDTYPLPPKFNAKEYGLGGKQYEAFQPPVYYIVSIPFYFIGGNNFILKIFILRFWGLIQLLFLCIFSYLILKKIFSNIDNKNLFIYLGLLIVGFTPAILIRSITIGNATLSALFITIFFYQILKLSEAKEIIKKNIISLGIISALAILTKVTSIFIIPLGFLLFLFLKKNFLKNSLLYIVTILIIISPWLLFNYNNYNTPTANNQAQELHSTVINPNNEDLFGIKYIKNSIVTIFLDGIWIPQENNYASLNKYAYFIEITRLINIIWISSFVILFIKNTINFLKKRNYDKFLLITSIGIILATSEQVIGTLANNWPIMLGRYFHPLLVIIAIFYSYFIYLIINNFSKKIFIPITIIIFCLPIIINIEYLIQVKDIYIENMIKENDVIINNGEYLKQIDSGQFYLTDSNWVNGISRNWAGFFVPNIEKYINKYKVGRIVKFPNGESRKVTQIISNGLYLNIYLNGNILNSKKIGFPTNFTLSDN